jgi:hypothetical protein
MVAVFVGGLLCMTGGDSWVLYYSDWNRRARERAARPITRLEET